MTEETTDKRVFDFRMDPQSWFMIAGIFVAFLMVLLPASFGAMKSDLSTIKMILYSLVLTFGLICISCIPIVLICLLIKRIPDIDYAIWFSTIVMILSLISISL